MGNIFRRKNYFINKGFQGRYLLQFYGLITSGALLFLLFFLLTTPETLVVISGDRGATSGSTPFILIKDLIVSNWMLFLLMGITVTVVSLLMTHKIAGPLHKFQLVLKDMQEGVLDPNCKLRDRDEAQEVMEEFRRTNRFLADKVKEMQGIADKLRESAITDNPHHKAINFEIDRLHDIVGGFTIKE